MGTYNCQYNSINFLATNCFEIWASFIAFIVFYFDGLLGGIIRVWHFFYVGAFVLPDLLGGKIRLWQFFPVCAYILLGLLGGIIRVWRFLLFVRLYCLTSLEGLLLLFGLVSKSLGLSHLIFKLK